MSSIPKMIAGFNCGVTMDPETVFQLALHTVDSALVVLSEAMKAHPEQARAVAEAREVCDAWGAVLDDLEGTREAWAQLRLALAAEA